MFELIATWSLLGLAFFLSLLTLYLIGALVYIGSVRYVTGEENNCLYRTKAPLFNNLWQIGVDDVVINGILIPLLLTVVSAGVVALALSGPDVIKSIVGGLVFVGGTGFFILHMIKVVRQGLINALKKHTEDPNAHK